MQEAPAALTSCVFAVCSSQLSTLQLYLLLMATGAAASRRRAVRRSKVLALAALVAPKGRQHVQRLQLSCPGPAVATGGSPPSLEAWTRAV